VQRLEQRPNRELGKDHHVVHAAERGHELGTRLGGEHRPAVALERAHGRVVVDGHHQHVGFLRRAFEIPHVPDVQQVEGAVGKGNGAPGRAVRLPRASRDRTRTARHPRRTAAVNSAALIVAVPRFITTRPPA
jgi:hypothetical protein